MKKALIYCIIVFLVVLTACSSNNSGLSNDDIIHSAQSYIQKNYKDFSDGTFKSETTSVEDLGNSEYKVNGKISDNGGWEHTATEEIQISPNQSKFIVCLLKIDGTIYVSNSPKSQPGSSENSELQVNFDFIQQNLRTASNQACYEMIAKNTGNIAVKGLKIKIICDSPDTKIVSQYSQQNLKSTGNCEYEWSIPSQIDIGESMQGYLMASFSETGNHTIKFYPSDSSGNPFYDSNGKQTEYVITSTTDSAPSPNIAKLPSSN